MAGNMFSGFIQAGQNRSDAIGQGIGALAQNYQQKQNQQQAMNYLQQAYELADTDPQASQMAFVQAAQLDPDAVNTLMQAKKIQSGGGTESTANMREYQLARDQGYEGSFMDFQRDSMGGDQGTSTQRDFERYQMLKETDPEAAKRFGRAAGFESKEGMDLSVHLQKRLSTSSDQARKSRSTANRMTALADDMEKLDFGGGLFGGSWGEALKDATGNQDAETELRRRYYQIRGSQVVENLPPGAASDTDIKLALAGFPTDNASADQISSFLRGVAKLENRTAQYNDFVSNYISENGSERGLSSAWREYEENSVPVMSTEQYGDVTEADIKQTMKETGMSRDEVMQRLRGE